jgi:hypothetical protein
VSSADGPLPAPAEPAEPPHAQPADAQPADAHPADARPAAAEPTDAQPGTAEPVAEPADGADSGEDGADPVAGAADPAALIRPPGGRPAVPLAGGDSLIFGRAADRAPAGRHAARQPSGADLEVSDSRRVSRRAGVLEVTPFGVLLTNTGSNPLLLDEAGLPRRTVRPGQVHLLGVGAARIGFAGTDDALELDVLVGGRPGSAGGEPDESTAERTRPAWSLVEGTAYFACLVALCEPALRHPDSPWIPTSQQVADRLWECGLLPERRTGDWVDRRLDDVREKLPIGERPWSAERARRASPQEQEQALARMRSGAPRRTGRKEQLVDFAVGNGIVTLQTVRRLFG